MRIPAADLYAQHVALQEKITAAFERVVESSAFVNGPETVAFEREFAAYCGAEDCVGVANGTDALAMALRVLDIGPGAAVAVPAFTFAGTAEAVRHVGATPVFVDIDPDNFLMDPSHLEKVVRSSPVPIRAIMPVHLYGQPADLDEIRGIATQIGAAVVEDAAQAHGARYGTQRIGSHSGLSCFSFYPTKNLGALGDGGAVTTHDASLAQRLRSLRDHGQSEKYVHSEIGFNSRLDSIQAAILRIKLPLLDSWNSRRQAIARQYGEQLADLSNIQVPRVKTGREHVYHLYVIRCAQRESLRAFLAENGIATSIHYPVALHDQPAFREWRHTDLRGAAHAAREVLALPMYPDLSDAAVAEVSRTIRTWAGRQ